ncbi:class II aldolase/adducin family protein [Massilia sp. PWRC2]|uniref:class II aldolase/adducin family protein n=1 Tax=Massilia sp. PWRC2 TaxID=2804626 RepID=UPI003CF1931D
MIKHVCVVTVAMAAAMALPQAGAQAPRDSRTAAVVDELVNANRILFAQGVVDGFGHISARSPVDPSHFFMARSIAPADVKPVDIMEFDRDGKVVGTDARQPYAERFIHSEIYKARPLVMSVVHAHSASVIPFSITSVPLKPVYHMSGFLGKGAPVFDIRDGNATHADSDLLVKNERLGAQLADKLGPAAVVLMRGHGFTAVGASVPVAVFRSVYTEQNARIEIEALKLGTPTFLTEGEAKMTEETMERLSVRSWDMWKKQADQAR